jgi:5-methylcytosine-specific restriction endonuclease McrA
MAWDQNRRPSSDYLHPKKQQRVLTTHHGVCHLCGHGGAEQVDHIIPWSEWTNPTLSVHDASNLAPAHGQPCPTCSITCHDNKTKAEAARGRARATARQQAAKRRPPEQHPGSLPPPGGVPAHP